VRDRGLAPPLHWRPSPASLLDERGDLDGSYRSTQRHGATLWQAAYRAAAALRVIHHEQVLMRELVWQSSRVPVDPAGRLAWTPSLDGPQLTGRHLSSPDEPQAAQAMTSTPRPRAAAAGQPGQQLERK